MRGEVVNSTAPENIGQNRSKSSSYISGKETKSLSEIFKDNANSLGIRMFAPILSSDSNVLGVVEVLASAAPFVALTEDYTGLGYTGEVELVKRNNAGDTVFLTPLRFDSGAALSLAISKNDLHNPAVYAASGDERVFETAGFSNYQGKEVFAVTRYIETLNWGLVAEINRSEALSSVDQLTRVFIISIFITILLLVGVAYLLAHGISNPILELSKFAHVIQTGDFSKRISIKDKGELGYLGSTLNDMAEKLRELYLGLEKKVSLRTKELEQSKNRLTLATKSAKMGVWEWDIAKDILTWDDQMYALYGVKKEDFGKAYDAWQKGLHPDDKKPGDDAIQAALKGEKEFSPQFRVVWPTGEVHYIQAHAVVDRDVAGKPLKMIGVNWDITQESIVDKEKTEFVSLASHQMKTPVGAVQWNLEMLIDGDYGEISQAQKEVLQETYKMNTRMNDLINALLNVSRIELGVFIIEPTPTDFTEICEEVLREMEPRLIMKKHELVRDYEASLPKVSADQKLLRIVFQNLISNAIKYTPDHGKVIVAIKTDGEHIRVSVANNGEPIPEADKLHIFKKLYRASNAQEQDPDGNGLGLYLVKQIVENAGGRVTFTSDKNTGTIFTCSFLLSGMIRRDGSITLS